MKQKTVKLFVKINPKELFSFMLWHTYTAPSGLFGLCLSVIALIMLVTGFADGDAFRSAVLLVLGSVFTVVNPILLYMKAKNQAQTNPVYQKEMIYTIDENGITLKAGEATETVEWTKIRKCRKTRVIYMLYTTRIHAILLPLASLKGDKELVEHWINTKVRGKQK